MWLEGVEFFLTRERGFIFLHTKGGCNFVRVAEF